MKFQVTHKTYGRKQLPCSPYITAARVADLATAREKRCICKTQNDGATDTKYLYLSFEREVVRKRNAISSMLLLRVEHLDDFNRICYLFVSVFTSRKGTLPRYPPQNCNHTVTVQKKSRLKIF